MNQYKYKLEPYRGNKTRHRCPGCEKEKTFTYYIDSETGEYIGPKVGKCNREINCGYHYTPRQFLQDNPKILLNDTKDFTFKKVTKSYKALQTKSFSKISGSLFKNSLKSYEENHFVMFLISKFGNELTSDLISRYFIGTSKHWLGSNVFWQIDLTGNVRTGKVMLYNPINGKRVKEPFSHIAWAHKLINQPDFELKQCFFGEHLLKDETKPIAIVESEKTAIIASGYLPQFIWLASGSLSNLNQDKCSILKGRTITLFPDLNGFDAWSKKSNALYGLRFINISDLLENNATEAERKKGLDLADYLLRFEPGVFKEQSIPKIKASTTCFGLEENEHSDSETQAFIDKSGKLYIRTPIGKSFTVYPSIQHYNDRIGFPDFELIENPNLVIYKEVKIDFPSLTISN